MFILLLSSGLDHFDAGFTSDDLSHLPPALLNERGHVGGIEGGKEASGGLRIQAESFDGRRSSAPEASAEIVAVAGVAPCPHPGFGGRQGTGVQRQGLAVEAHGQTGSLGYFPPVPGQAEAGDIRDRMDGRMSVPIREGGEGRGGVSVELTHDANGRGPVLV